MREFLSRTGRDAEGESITDLAQVRADDDFIEALRSASRVAGMR